MGIAVPRPTIRRAESRKIRNNLAVHADFMERLIGLGYDREEASRRAFFMLKAGGKWIETPAKTGH